MGENKHMIELDTFAKKYVQQIKPTKTSVDFTAVLMDKIEAESKQNAFKTESLISKKGWLLVASIFIAVLFIPYKQSEKSFIEIPEINFSLFDKIQIPNIFDTISVSNITIIAVLLFSLMVMIQVFYLKNYFEKRIG